MLYTKALRLLVEEISSEYRDKSFLYIEFHLETIDTYLPTTYFYVLKYLFLQSYDEIAFSFLI